MKNMIKALYKKDKKLATQAAKVLGIKIKIKASLSVGDIVKVDMKVVKKDWSLPTHIKLVNRVIKNAEGKPVIISINGDQADIAESKMGALLGTVRVPLKALKLTKAEKR